MQSEIIITQIIMLGIVVIIGAAAAKTGIITENLKEGIASLVFNITLPLLILSSFTALDITWDLLRNGIMVIILAYLAIFFMLMTGRFSARLQKMRPETSSIHVMHTAFGNIVFLGFPLMDALFPGGQGLFYATLFYLVSNSVMWTAGVNILSNKHKPDTTSTVKNLLNPNTLAFVIGIALMMGRVNLPAVIDVPLRGLGQTTHYLSMLYIGGMLAQTNIRGVFAMKRVYLLSLNKMIVSPAILIILFSLLLRVFSLEMDTVAFSVVVLQAGTPCMAIIVVLARRFNADDIHATENVFVTTLFSILTLPFLYWMVQAIAF
ncbi:MAG: AEC family transporter [Marinilabiliales bacterium]|nr:MAG: AEC family transporter [Marinilabiliales bacterium]